MTRGATFDRVYLALRSRLLSGGFAPGMALEPAALSIDLNASITPVRDALQRLAGERLIDAPRHDGFRMPIVTEAGLRDLYQWCAQLLNLVIRSTTDLAGACKTEPPTDAAVGTAALFSAIAHCSPSREHLVALSSSIERLAPVRAVEHRFVIDGASSLARLTRAVAEDDRVSLLREIALYHRARLKLVPELTTVLMASYRATSFGE